MIVLVSRSLSPKVVHDKRKTRCQFLREPTKLGYFLEVPGCLVI